MRNRLIAAAATLGLLAGCTAGNLYIYPPEITEHYLITMGESPRPYVSKGFVQITGELVEFTDAPAAAAKFENPAMAVDTPLVRQTMLSVSP